jgi:hypothetical protein
MPFPVQRAISPLRIQRKVREKRDKRDKSPRFQIKVREKRDKRDKSPSYVPACRFFADLGRSASVSSRLGWPQAGVLWVFSKFSKLLNQEDALSAPCYAVISALRRHPRGALKCCGQADPLLSMSHFRLLHPSHHAHEP